MSERYDEEARKIFAGVATIDVVADALRRAAAHERAETLRALGARLGMDDMAHTADEIFFFSLEMSKRDRQTGREEMRELAAARTEAMVPDPSDSRSVTVRKATDWIAAWVTATAMAIRALPVDDEAERKIDDGGVLEHQFEIRRRCVCKNCHAICNGFVIEHGRGCYAVLADGGGVSDCVCP